MAEVGDSGQRSIMRNERGYRIGESHHNCRIPDEVVEMARSMHERGVGQTEIANALRLPLGTVKKIICFERRGQVPRAP